jgi:2,4-dienoyl-CoA reductase-like NADH-dependent reductase (Old Yellow Enzyme family)
VPESEGCWQTVGASPIGYADWPAGPPRAWLPGAFATLVRRASGLPVGAVGLITEPQQAEKIVSDGEADAVFLARELLRDPHWAQRAAEALGADTLWPEQHLRARP